VHPCQLLEVKNVSLSRGGKQLLKAINFSLKPGKWIHIQGDNGIGKTTLLRAICSLIPLDEGQICWAGQDTKDDLPMFLQNILFMGHKLALKDELSPLENLLFETQLMQTNPQEEELLEALNYFGLKGREHVPLVTLSQGQKRRVSLAKLKLSPAPLWILDEPLVALDVQSIKWVTQLMDQHIELGGSILFTSHQPLELLHSGDELGLGG